MLIVAVCSISEMIGNIYCHCVWKDTKEVRSGLSLHMYRGMSERCVCYTKAMQSCWIVSTVSEWQVRLAILDHVHEMALMTEPCEFVGSESCQQLALCIVQWTNEPKSSEVRKVRCSFMLWVMFVLTFFHHLVVIKEIHIGVLGFMWLPDGGEFRFLR